MVGGIRFDGLSEEGTDIDVMLIKYVSSPGGGIGAVHCLMEILSSERRVSFSFELFNNVSEIPRGAWWVHAVYLISHGIRDVLICLIRR